ncbi:MAG: FAD-dependent oxidoreductase, partial [Bacteroidota bacterium]
MTIHQETDVIIIGSGMGGMSAATLFAHSGLNVTILEAAHLPGGCSSSYKRKGYWFESGATTLIGFNENQPLWYLEKETGVRIPRQEIAPSMTVHLDGKRILRHQSIDGWKQEAVAAFGNKRGQERFWDLAKSVSDVVWKVSLKNPFFPPQNLSDWVRLGTSNNPADVWVLPYAFKSVRDVMRQYGVDSPGFVRFVDEQLMITAQATSEEVPFLFGAAGLTYTNYSNYYVPGGLLN